VHRHQEIDRRRDRELHRLGGIEIADDPERLARFVAPVDRQEATSGASLPTSSSSPSKGIVSPEW
jgi:hypothetical protein